LKATCKANFEFGRKLIGLKNKYSKQLGNRCFATLARDLKKEGVDVSVSTLENCAFRKL